jgi:multicomponent Na+:H+ antiporter subunit D
VFFGWGPCNKKRKKDYGSEREADSGGRKVEKVMLLPAALLIGFAICLTFAPGLDHVALRSATDFHDGTLVRERILQNAHAVLKQPEQRVENELSEEPVSERYSLKTGFINVAMAFFVAFVGLKRDRLRLARIRILNGAACLLRDIHSGAVGDYAAWLTAGVAVFAGTLLLLFRT